MDTSALRTFITTKWKAWGGALAAMLAVAITRWVEPIFPGFQSMFGDDLGTLLALLVIGAGGWLLNYLFPANQPQDAGQLAQQARSDPATANVVKSAARQIGTLALAGILAVGLLAACAGDREPPAGEDAEPRSAVAWLSDAYLYFQTGYRLAVLAEVIRPGSLEDRAVGAGLTCVGEALKLVSVKSGEPPSGAARSVLSQ